jgi:hypothetical protein
MSRNKKGRLATGASVNTGKSELDLEPIPVYWAFVVGILAVAAQIITYVLRFGSWNAESPFSDYLLFFMSGALGGFVLFFFLNNQETRKGRWIVLAAFLLISPVALLVMLGGGLFGPLGILMWPQIPWALFAWLGSQLSRFVTRK